MSPAGQERSVPLRDAERELGRAWRALDDASRHGGGEGMLRLREVNLVVICREETLAESRRTAGLMAQAHPARLILIVVDPPDGRMPAQDAPSGTSGSPLAYITTSCLIDESSGHHVCSEEVVIRGVHGEEDSLLAAVLQLLVPDVPVVGWWVEELAGHPPGLRWLTGIADQVVVDLRRSLDPLAGLETLRDLTRGDGEGGLRELEWLRSADWRVLTAELFEQSENRSLIPRMTHLEVEHNDAPMQALLYAAWFASRLGLGSGERGWWVEGGSLCVDVVAPGATDEPSLLFPAGLVMQLRPARGGGHEQRGLTGIRILTRSTDGPQETDGQTTHDGQSMALRRRPHSCLCSATIGPEEQALTVKSMRLVEQEDYQDLSRLIDTPLRDALLYEALLHADELVERPGFELDILSTA